MKKVMASTLVIMAMLLCAVPQAWAEGNNEVSLSSKSEYELSDMLDENIAGGNNELVKKILAALNFEQDYLNKSLFTASEHGNIEIIEYLLEKGADPTALAAEYKNPIDERTPIQFAKNKETERVFIMHCTDRGAKLNLAAEYGFLDILEELNPSSDEINNKEHYSTLMHEAAASGSAECVKYLMAQF